MSFFNRFPIIAYDIKGDENYKLATNILKRVKLRSGIRSGLLLFDLYDVKEGEKPEDVAVKWFGSAHLHWVILMTNNITDRYYQWPMKQADFANYLTDKYGAGNEDSVHHYEITQASGRTSANGPGDTSYLVECNSDEDGASTVTNREYEERQQDKNRQIRLLNPRYLNQFIEEFDRLISE
tara:strand:- start:1166 stop:1708 length:543 start_codon:yes stop_codon:yes gene_type:complete